MVKVLFVCLGNICRSPSAEAAFIAEVKRQGLSSEIAIDSAGTIGHHAGEKADPRTIKHGKLRGLEITSISRKFDSKTDFATFDYIIAMDDANVRDLKILDPSGMCHCKIYKMTDFKVTRTENIVPDPYYCGPEGFELVLDIVQDCSLGLLKHMRQKHSF
ncbi:MAG: low molecular weight phosphotyrosine protein phosphatase [Bdellovibrio sp.]|nr:low molecular weight phosphotyrosine protein phosphatase [Bdellovibrio sp.]